MAINTRGTEMWFYDETNSQVVKIGCPTAISPVGGARDSFESPTCLDGNKQKFTGGITWEDLTISINLDPKDASHKRLWELFKAGAENIPFAIGFADGTAAPTWSANAWVLAKTRSWYNLKGSVLSDSSDFSGDSVVTATISIAPNDIDRVAKA